MTSIKNENRGIAVVGAGPVGMLAALSLANKGYPVSLIGPSSADANEFRTTALMMPAIHTLQKLHVWDTIKHYSATLSSIRIIDVTSKFVRPSHVSFSSSEIGEETFGYNIPNFQLNNALIDAIVNTPKITRFFSSAQFFHHKENHICLTLEDGRILQASLIVAADGRHSLARTAAGIGTKQWDYSQKALVLNFSHYLPHHNTSTEFYTESGSLTQIPLLGNKSSLIWITKTSHAEELLNMEIKTIEKKIEDQMHSILGKLTIETPIQSWPLLGLISERFAKKQTVLVGEAAHVFPPIGAQGLNLSFRDIQTLLNILPSKESHFDVKDIITRYNCHRKPDVFTRTGTVHILNQSLRSRVFPVHIMRSVFLELLTHCLPLQRFFMREGVYPGYGVKAIIRTFMPKFRE